MALKPKFFKTPADFRNWLATHHTNAKELLVGFYKKDSGKPSITWPESVDEALCFGWIDGIRRRIDDDSYSIRFTPRRSSSTWSAVNIARAKALSGDGRMAPAGDRAFAARKEDRSGIYSYEQRSAELIEPYAGKLRRNKAAAKYFASQPPSYRKAANWWIVSAKREETRLSRLEKLITLSAAGQRIPQFTPRTKQSF
jgi:uncharacterized protein YdeI (YjbR/CyaY-like superfamily)